MTTTAASTDDDEPRGAADEGARLADPRVGARLSAELAPARRHRRARGLAGDGIELRLSSLRPDARDLLGRAGALASIGSCRVHAGVIDGILAFAFRTPGAEERVTVLNDLIAFIRERRTRADASVEGVGLLAALEEKLELEPAAAGGASAQTAAR